MKKWIVILLCMALLALPFPADAAGEVTDTLTVKVGYWGMDTDSYVTVGSYHWSELEQNLPLHQVAYSFYRAGTDGVYNTVIDSAYGFYLSDLISYAGVYAGDVQSIQFYTRDQSVGYFTSFTYGELFGTSRYFFGDLAAHIHPVLDEAGNVTGYEANEAWNDCTLVQPMLALEDNWQSYEIGTEHTAPDYSAPGTGNRFRLLFGQSHPLETRTNQTAKYTHTVYLTLTGGPRIGQMPELDASIGSHVVSFAVSVGNGALLDALAGYLQISSSDDSVLRITSVTVRPDPNYSDLAVVEVTYEVLQPGTATLSASVGAQVIASSDPIVAESAPTQPAEPAQPAAPTQPPAPAEPPAQPAAPTDAQPPAQPQEPAAPTDAQAPPADGDVAAPPAPAEAPDTAGSGQTVVVLDPETANAFFADKPEARPQSADARQPVVQLTLQPQADTGVGLWTALGAGLLLLLGGLYALLYYRKER